MSRNVRRLALALVCALSLPVAAAAQDVDRHIVKFRDGGRAPGLAALQAAGGSVLLELGPQNAAAARIPAVALQGLRNNPNIEYIEQDTPRYPMAQTVPYGVPMVQADAVPHGANTRKVCIIDSGYYTGHEDLKSGLGVTGDTDSGTGNWYQDSCGHGSVPAAAGSAVASRPRNT